MKKLTFLLIATLLLTIINNGRAQVVTKYGDNLSTLNGIIKAYYDVVIVKKGGKIFYERDSLLHWPNAKVGAVELSKPAKPYFIM